jgi:hypothetical protein
MGGMTSAGQFEYGSGSAARSPAFRQTLDKPPSPKGPLAGKAAIVALVEASLAAVTTAAVFGEAVVADLSNANSPKNGEIWSMTFTFTFVVFINFALAFAIAFGFLKSDSRGRLITMSIAVLTGGIVLFFGMREYFSASEFRDVYGTGNPIGILAITLFHGIVLPIGSIIGAWHTDRRLRAKPDRISDPGV